MSTTAQRTVTREELADQAWWAGICDYGDHRTGGAEPVIVTGLDLAGIDMSGRDLNGFTFRDCTLAGANFAGVLNPPREAEVKFGIGLSGLGDGRVARPLAHLQCLEPIAT
jgi:hypothetical protein